ncbi:MAG: phosphoribosylaminoimidazolesuccinocarboxamide synthase [archaeon]|nr:phosphoribosylaminoimidazolesuccinocarboxamide synthase [archaeon]
MNNKEKIYKEKIKKHMNLVLENGFIPEFGMHKRGKVRDIHFTGNKIGSPIIMVASDRVSAFDRILPTCIPFKGEILNLFNRWAFDNMKDIVPNSLFKSPDPNIIVQKQLKNIGFECIVRGFVWGSMALDYENGARHICNIPLPEKLLRYQKLPKPFFTPSTKAEIGHDENVSFEDMVKSLGKELAEKVRNLSIELYGKGMELALEKNLVFIDTKYEFGLDEKGDLYIIDEANTPDSSRYCTIEEYKKFEHIADEMSKGIYKDVTELLSERPELKIKELSKQFVRDVLIESGYDENKPITRLTDEQVIETSWRYISLYEKLTGQDFKFPKDTIEPKLRLAGNIVSSGVGKGCCAVIMAGSDSDAPHIKKITGELDKFSIPYIIRICSAHKQPKECENIINYYNASVEPVLIIAVAGGTDALSGIVSFHSVHPVISCPPQKEKYISCIENPPGSSNALILKPENAAKFAAQYFSFLNRNIKDVLLRSKHSKIRSLEEADSKALKKEQF